MKDSIKNIPDVIWAQEYNPGWGGGRWYSTKPSLESYAFAEGVSDAQKLQQTTYTRYVKGDEGADIFAWYVECTLPNGQKHQIGYFRSSARPEINATVGYRKAD